MVMTTTMKGGPVTLDRDDAKAIRGYLNGADGLEELGQRVRAALEAEERNPWRMLRRTGVFEEAPKFGELCDVAVTMLESGGPIVLRGARYCGGLFWALVPGFAISGSADLRMAANSKVVPYAWRYGDPIDVPPIPEGMAMAYETKGADEPAAPLESWSRVVLTYPHGQESIVRALMHYWTAQGYEVPSRVEVSDAPDGLGIMVERRSLCAYHPLRLGHSPSAEGLRIALHATLDSLNDALLSRAGELPPGLLHPSGGKGVASA